MAARALKTEEEISAVPLDHPVLVELPDGVGEIEVGDEKPTKKIEADDGSKVLQEQLDAMKAANKAAEERNAALERERDTARKAADDRAKELAEQRNRTDSLEGDFITGSLAAAQKERDGAKAKYIRAYETGDASLMADAQSEIGRAEARILSLESGAVEIAERKERKAEPETRLQTTVDPIAAIDANPNLMSVEKDWLKAHQDAVVDPRRNARLGVAYDDAVSKGLIRGTADYFAHLEQFMGYKKAAETEDGETIVQAPPSRQERGGDGRPTNGKITLSPDQREMARNLGITEIEYAKQVQAFEAAKKADPEKYGSRN
jgi:hypothetical protein